MNIHQGVWEGESEVKSNLETQIPAGFVVLIYVQLGRSLMRTLGQRKLCLSPADRDYLKGIYIYLGKVVDICEVGSDCIELNLKSPFYKRPSRAPAS